MPMSNDVWLLLERDARRLGHFSLGLIGEGRRLADLAGGALSAVIVGGAIPDLGGQAGAYGITRLYRLPDDRPFGPDRLAASIADLLSRSAPRLFLSVASSFGADLMPRVAARLGVPLVTNTLDIALTDRFEFSKAISGGKQRATLRGVAGGVQLATISPEGLPPPARAASPRVATIVELPPPAAEAAPGSRVRAIIKADHRTIDIREAEFVVAIGKGVGTSEGRAAVERFADLIGAAIGGSRPAVDAGLVPYERQVGQTGKKISPRLIILCGISGSEYFMQGIEPGAVKIAINPDRKAPIFGSADLGIVADANELIPRFLAAVQAGPQAG